MFSIFLWETGKGSDIRVILILCGGSMTIYLSQCVKGIENKLLQQNEIMLSSVLSRVTHYLVTNG